MEFKVKQLESQRESFGNYKYQILMDDRVVAIYWHDYRGDGSGIEFQDGSKESDPLGGLTSFLSGGGPKPLELTASAVKYLSEKLG